MTREEVEEINRRLESMVFKTTKLRQEQERRREEYKRTRNPVAPSPPPPKKEVVKYDGFMVSEDPFDKMMKEQEEAVEFRIIKARKFYAGALLLMLGLAELTRLLP